MDHREGLSIQPIVDPPPIFSIDHQASILQRLEVEREPRLACAQFVGQITDALLALTKELEQTQPGFIAKGTEDEEPLLGKRTPMNGHAVTIGHDPWASQALIALALPPCYGVATIGFLARTNALMNRPSTRGAIASTSRLAFARNSRASST